ncbi:iron-containing redox enzyme family protein [Aspergillus clavatus NRRL 1]|uniref:Uncharacterized protein n=1 Tax=Aspergillus clavatus (strain ATCC 1007 / CBS 513.65 / DSM 816 / NCTC 3887 / NRRL 1 / QM 1276 / 107) TaxID=344612 RepID=A1C7A9_ASPCL|nr:uncharacterized protein ACLA_073150 [Aspergillus clavatus NRRL 1]EAW14280.1 hypothetical protein ACLA_073150 [Aspergillus clavatus NRRL 1]
MIACTDFLSLFTLSCLILYWVWTKYGHGHALLRLEACTPRKAEKSLFAGHGKAGIDRGSGAEELQMLKETYFKLQNLEAFPTILPAARQLLCQMLSGALLDATKRAQSDILGLGEFTPGKLGEFVRTAEAETKTQWENYLARRTSGSRRELFPDAERAREWLTQKAPLKYVDGAWLGHIHKVTTPFALRRVTKDAWQVLSEELGDGDLRKNHVFLYQQLLGQVSSHLPAGDSEDFIHPRHGLDDIGVWRAAVAQLLISLFPHEFLPEILGFNLHFEGLTLTTIQVAHELKELGIDPYYFLIHITIDNSDSGHTAMALETVVKYLDTVRIREGNTGAQKAWKRIQAGYVLSERSATVSVRRSKDQKAVPVTEDLAEAVTNIFQAKAAAADKIHCASRMTIGGRSLVEWLDPIHIGDSKWQLDFLCALANCTPWVKRGDSEGSRLIHELCWGGRMFGSFTHHEVETVKNWIDSLDNFYMFFVGNRDDLRAASPDGDIRYEYPVFSSLSGLGLLGQPAPIVPSEEPFVLPRANRATMTRILPLWLTHPCLLEGFVTVPFKTTNALHCTVIRLLRSQYGFGIERHGVEGIDEVHRDAVGLVELGLELARTSGAEGVGSLRDALERWPSDFATTMLHLSMQPTRHRGLLLGMTSAFVSLHESVASSDLLSPKLRRVLRDIVAREQESLQICRDELRGNGREYGDFFRGVALAKREILAVL